MKKAWLIALACLLLGAIVLWSTFSPPAVPPVPVAANQDLPAPKEQRPATPPSQVAAQAAPRNPASRSLPAIEDLGATQDRLLAEQNDAQAQKALGERYLTGNGVPMDEAEALQWYQRAARQGDPAAQLKVGQMYEDGQGTNRNPDRASLWFTKAAESGDPAAQANLADMYEFGERYRSVEAAAYWNERAANQGDAGAQVDLGRMYQNGTGVPQDNVQAFVWYSLAAASGDESAISSRNVLSTTLSSAELSAAKDLVLKWKPQTRKP